MVIIVFGLPGSGKSYFASRLAAKLKAQYVNSDELRKKMFSIRTYTDAEKLQVYESMLALMTDAIIQKTHIVLDATFYKESLRKQFERTAIKFKEKIIYMEVTASESIIRDRLRKPRTFSEADFEVYTRLKEIAEPLLQEHLTLVSTNNNITSLLRKAIHHINAST